MKRLVGNTLEPDLTNDPTGQKKQKKAKRPDGKEYKPGKGRIARFRLPDDSDWLEPENWPAYDAALVCRTAGCPVEGEAIPGRVGENVDGVFRAACGGCGQEITEIWVEDSVTPIPLDLPDPPKSGNAK